MKRTLLVGTFYTLAGAATLLLAASIFYSCRSGGDPHHKQPSHDAPVEESHSALPPRPVTDGMQLTLAHAPSSSSEHLSSPPAPTA